MRRLGSKDNVQLVLAALLYGMVAHASSSSIYSCIDANGKRVTADRPIVECVNREQRLLNPDGSVQRVLPPTLTADELAEVEAAERKAAVDRAVQQDAVRHDRNLLVRYPNEAAHRRARESALDDVRSAIRLSETRFKLLAAERKPLLEEAEFYVGKQLPGNLKRSLDANDAAFEAQRTLVQNQQAEVVRINALFDAELDRLRRLWAGAKPGSMGMLTAEAASAPPNRAAEQSSAAPH